MGRRVQNREVVTNYVSNALNHLDGEKIVEIKILKLETQVKVTVFNTGTPIPEADLPTYGTSSTGKQGPHQRIRRQRHWTFHVKAILKA